MPTTTFDTETEVAPAYITSFILLLLLLKPQFGQPQLDFGYSIAGNFNGAAGPNPHFRHWNVQVGLELFQKDIHIARHLFDQGHRLGAVFSVNL
jgi:hypothetical protein